VETTAAMEACATKESRSIAGADNSNPWRKKKAALARPAGWVGERRYWDIFWSSTMAPRAFGK
jgi:hypothetical protein